MEEGQHSISIQDLVTKYGDRTILNGINLDIRAGETMVILGGSGCGKSTLLRHMVGLSRPTSGNIIVRGQNLCDLSEDRMNELLHKVGMAFQGSALFNSMTIGENVSLALREHTKLET